MNDLLVTPWFLWGAGIILAFPIGVVLIGEWIYRAETSGSALVPVLRGVRGAVLPLLAIDLFLIEVLGVDSQGILGRAIATMLWISLIYAALLALNVVVFSQAAEGSWRGTAPKLFQDLLRLSLVAVGASIVLSVVWNRDLGGLLAALGVGSIVLGLALQETLGNLMSGIALLFERSVNTGDWVEVGDREGEVIEVNWRSVQIRDLRRNLLVIPNSLLGREVFVNHARPARQQRLRLPFGFSLDDAPNRVKEVLVETARQTPDVLAEPPPLALVREVLEDRIRYEMTFSISEPRHLRRIVDDFTTRLWYAMRRAGLHFPYPVAYEIKRDDPLAVEVDDSQRLHHVLAGVPGFRRLDAASLATVAAASRVVEYAAGETVLEMGSEPNELFVVIGGRARLESKTASEARASVSAALLETGEIFGEVALSRGQPSAFRVVAESDLELACVPVAALEDSFGANAPAASEFARVIDLRKEIFE